MRAHAGDWIVVKSRTVGGAEQRGRIMEVGSPEGAPPYVVHWMQDDRVSTFFPGTDAQVLTPDELAAAEARQRIRFQAIQHEIVGSRRKP
ncbi:DUF1918 domain-containing protein [Amycolatopsis pithecellobii]|uniref:DUF1918 domain-containing protein n=1 Tax=Amycolatopsis pithecellobii TaxID=664692 RepID=A0A6N7YRQ2_9PSEU|nr:DUF1918 domain-containing protein [Amycolatopsis pithecellobii]MTD54598.1 DUF1918 domain-containing protein [Amycolatopsis pithecellobii]